MNFTYSPATIGQPRAVIHHTDGFGERTPFGAVVMPISTFRPASTCSNVHNARLE